MIDEYGPCDLEQLHQNDGNQDSTEQIMAFSKKHMCKTRIELTCYLKLEKKEVHRWIFVNMAFFSSLYSPYYKIQG